jgi:hypothetical protein
MSSISGRDPLNPNDPEYYAPPWLRERAKLELSLSQEARPEPITASPISLPASFDIQLKNEVSNALWNPLDPEVIHQPPGLAREVDRRASLFSVAACLAAAVAVVMVGVLLFVIMKPASRQSVAASTSSDITGSISPPLPQSGQRDVGSKPALAEFQALLASVPPSQPSSHEQSQELLQQFLQWRKKASATETSR